MRLIEMDSTASLAEQMTTEVGPVVLINKFSVADNEADDLLAAWRNDAGFFRSQPGFISTQLHRGIKQQQPLSHYGDLGVGGRFSPGLRKSGASGGLPPLSAERCRLAPSVPEARGPGLLRGVSTEGRDAP